MSGPATLGHFRQATFAKVRGFQRTFRSPADDWPVGMAFVQTPRGVEYARLPSVLFANGATKDLLVDGVTDAMVQSGAFRYAVFINTHMIGPASFGDDLDALEEATATVQRGEARVADFPGAIEMLVATVGDAEEEGVWSATIRRDGKRLPSLGPWQSLTELGDEEARRLGLEEPHESFAEFGGRFTGLNEKLRRVRT